jgi:hypothetical protein
MFQSQISTEHLGANEADAVTDTLQDTVFFSSNVMFYPMLPFVSRHGSLATILPKIFTRDKWASFNLWEKFICTFLTMAAAAPMINVASEASSDTFIFEVFIDRVSACFKEDLGLDDDKNAASDKESSPSQGSEVNSGEKLDPILPTTSEQAGDPLDENIEHPGEQEDAVRRSSRLR